MKLLPDLSSIIPDSRPLTYGSELGTFLLGTKKRYAGLEVWLSPSNIEATETENLAYLSECAQAAEKLRADHGNMVFIVGCELTLFMKGLIAGETALDRLQTMFKPWRLTMSTIKHGSFHKRLNAFLRAAAAEIRTYFHGPLTYASGTWENVDWTPFDFVGMDYYRDKINRRFFRNKLRKIVAGANKPSYSVVASLPEGTGRADPGLPWEPKQAFHALAAYYGKA